MFFERMRLRRLPMAMAMAMVMAAGTLSWTLSPAAAAGVATKPAVAVTPPVKKSDVVTKTATVPPAAEQKRAKNPEKKKIDAPILRATIDLTVQRMTVTTSTGATHRWKISSGRRGHETPTGQFRPKWMARRWYSRKYDLAPMPYAVFFNGGIATHGTQSTRLLGRPASHGCIRLRTKNARTFYNLVRKYGRANTRIVVTGHAKQRPEAVARRNGANRRRTAERRPTRSYRYAEQYYGRGERSLYARPRYPFVYPADAPPAGYYRPY